jgi:Ras-related protein Rab-1A
MVYDSSDKKSFLNLQEWLNEVNRHAPDVKCKVIVSNKNDRSNKEVNPEEAKVK